MRYVVIFGVFVTLGYLEVGQVAIFGVAILVYLGFVGQDIQNQSKHLVAALSDQGDLRAEDVQGSVDSLRQELKLMARALHSVSGELAAVRAGLASRKLGPWET